MTQNVAVQSKCSAPLEVDCFSALASEHSHTAYNINFAEKNFHYVMHIHFLPCVTVLV